MALEPLPVSLTIPLSHATRNSACDTTPSRFVSALLKLLLVRASSACGCVTPGPLAKLIRAQTTSHCASLSFVGGAAPEGGLAVWGNAGPAICKPNRAPAIVRCFLIISPHAQMAGDFALCVNANNRVGSLESFASDYELSR